MFYIYLRVDEDREHIIKTLKTGFEVVNFIKPLPENTKNHLIIQFDGSEDPDMDVPTIWELVK